MPSARCSFTAPPAEDKGLPNSMTAPVAIWLPGRLRSGAGGCADLVGGVTGSQLPPGPEQPS